MSEYKMYPSSINIIRLIVIALLLAACSGDDPVGSSGEMLNGTVTVIGVSDNSGITVEAYPVVAINEELAAAIDAYTSGGPGVNQRTEFNPADTLALYSTVTSSDGKWSIADMEEGFYNLVYRGGELGLRIETNVEVPGNPRGIQANPKISLTTGSISNQSIVVENAALEIFGNPVLEASSTLTVSGDNYLIYGTGDFRLTVKSDLNFQPGATLSAIRSIGTNTPRLIFEGQNNLSVRGLIAVDDVRVQVNNASLSFADCVFRGGELSAGLEMNGSFGSVSRSLIRESREGISLRQMSSFNCDNSIFLDNAADFLASLIGQGVIERNTFLVSNEGMECGSSDGVTAFEIRNNLFIGGSQHIIMGPNSDLLIQFNEFRDADRNIHLEPESHPVPSMTAVVNNNSFINTATYAVQLERTTTLVDTIDALSNYWGTVNIPEINNLIFDRNDRPNEVEYNYVNFTPFATEPVQGAGIGGN